MEGKAFWLVITSLGLMLFASSLQLVYDVSDWNELYDFYEMYILIMHLVVFITIKGAREVVTTTSKKIAIDVVLAFVGGNVIDRLLGINSVRINDLIIPIITLGLVAIKHQKQIILWLRSKKK